MQSGKKKRRSQAGSGSINSEQGKCVKREGHSRKIKSQLMNGEEKKRQTKDEGHTQEKMVKVEVV